MRTCSYYPGSGPQWVEPTAAGYSVHAAWQQASADKTWQRIYEINGRYREWRPNMDVKNSEQQAINKLMGTIRINGLTYSEAINQFYNRGDVQQYIKNKAAALSGQRLALSLSSTNTF